MKKLKFQTPNIEGKLKCHILHIGKKKMNYGRIANVSFGIHYFEIAATLREVILVNGLLTNCEVWF